jgi:2'-5' RNA ligase
MSFWGIKLSSALAMEVHGLVAQIKRRSFTDREKVTWEHPDDYHLTLKFLSNVPPDLQRQMVSCLAPYTVNLDPVTFGLQGIRMFHRGRGGAVIWVGIEQQLQERLKDMAQGISRQLAELGIEEEKRPFVSHVTVGRVERYGGDLEAELNHFSDWRSKNCMTATCLDYMKRRKQPSFNGPIYETLETVVLRRG